MPSPQLTSDSSRFFLAPTAFHWNNHRKAPNKEKNMLPISTNQPLNNTAASHDGDFHYGWLLSLFVALLCTNMAKPAAALANDASLTPVGSITKALTNHDVTVQAVISNVREPQSPRAPYNVSLTEGGATLPLIYWP